MSIFKKNKEVGELGLRETAAMLFSPEGKNPYYKGETAIKNLDEVKERLQDFDASEAIWLASWFEYLGDNILSDKIKKNPKDFKKAILERYKQLVKYKF